MKKIISALALLTASLSGQIDKTPLSPFGIGACNQTSQQLDRWIPQMSAIGIANMRACRTSFGDVEPREGEWTFTRLDQQLQYAEQNKMEFFGLLLGNPSWNKKDPPGHLPVNNLPAWETYVSKVVKHTEGRIRYWEVWNEPPNFTGKDQTPEDYARIVVTSYRAAKAANPNCLVGLAAKSAHLNYLEQVIKAGAKDHFDYITLHPYEILGTVANNSGTEPIFMNIVPSLRKMLAAQNPAKKDVPVIFTEIGHDINKGTHVQAEALVKAYTMSLAQGVTCINWFQGMDGDSGPMGLLERNGTPRPAYTALAQLVKHLGHQPEYLGWVRLNDRHYGFLFQGNDSPLLITWAYQGIADVIGFGENKHFINPLTGNTTIAQSYELTANPIIILKPSPKLLTQARSNKPKPLTWGQDDPTTDTVSLSFGEGATTNGLRSLASESIASDVVAYGGSARHGSIPGGNVFVVNPAFLSYDSVPIEISAVVRRNEKNENSGFKLVYESTTGFKTAGHWYTVPDNKKWHTVTWKIADPQFVNYWGYNFSLVSDGDTYNKYYLKSISVKKFTP
ncbi:endo-1,4-beta-xylanase [Akkermansiaceae bacterium]|nr:endo-1,4-beta-xylanase [Akkermansiaceae bacterium]